MIKSFDAWGTAAAFQILFKGYGEIQKLRTGCLCQCVADKENGTDTIVKYAIDFMGESNIGTVTLSISPENNENGFVIRSKTTEFVK